MSRPRRDDTEHRPITGPTAVQRPLASDGGTGCGQATLRALFVDDGVTTATIPAARARYVARHQPRHPHPLGTCRTGDLPDSDSVLTNGFGHGPQRDA
jgi:hypothetical protein